MNDSATVPSIAAAAHVSFFDGRSNFRRLVFRGALLELVTIGFYRFWLATDIRRHLWSHTSVDGDAPEYTGTAKELFFGFLFAMAILAPIYLVYFLVGIEVERWKAFASAPLALFFYLFYQFAIYRARRYRLTRTVWRGVRFGMGGSGLSYAWRVLLWSLLAAVTLGIVLPWREAALERFKMRHTFYGNLAGRLDGTGGQFFKRGWWLWLLTVLAVLIPSALAVVTRSQVVVSVAYVALLVALPFIYGIYKAIEWRWWISGLRLGEVAFESDMRRRAMIGLYWKMLGWSLLLLVLLTIWVGAVVGAAYRLVDFEGTPLQKIMIVSQEWPVLAGSAVGYIVLALMAGMLTRIYLIHDVWRRAAESTTVHNLTAAQNVATQGPLVSALGEGFAGNLDIVGF